MTNSFKHLLAVLVTAFAFTLPACEKQHSTEATPSQPASGLQTLSGDIGPYQQQTE